jgi:hypothetical protein
MSDREKYQPIMLVEDELMGGSWGVVDTRYHRGRMLRDGEPLCWKLIEEGLREDHAKLLAQGLNSQNQGAVSADRS